MIWPAEHVIWYGLVGITRCMVWPVGPRTVYSMVWRAAHGIMVWPDMGLGIVYGMAWRAWHGMALRARNGV